MAKSKPTKDQGNKKKKPGSPVRKDQALALKPILVWGALAGILLITLLVYLPAFQNGFVWDDLVYIQKNPLIYTINLSDIFSTYHAGNYHPITILGHAIEYNFFGFDETGYHVVNVFIHLFNTALVFYFIRKLTGNLWIAFITSLLFGIHPMHVESVAWVSELKDLLYTFFYLGTLIAYLHFMDERRIKWFVLALGLFLLSLMSKGMAVSLPVILVLLDFVKGRLTGTKIWLEKIPFFLLSLTFGIIAVFAQHSESALHADVIPLFQRIVFACYGFITYIQKLFIPLSLYAYYPYPVGPNDPIPPLYFSYVLLLLLLAGLVVYSLRFNKKVILGLGFFTVTIFLVLKLLPVGYAVMADRYSYIPSIAIFYLVAEGLYWLYEKKGNMLARISGAVLLIGCSAFYGYSTHVRCKVFENNYTLWTDVIQKNDQVAIAFLNRGVASVENKQYKEAEADLNRAIELNPEYADAFYNRGIVNQNTNRTDKALQDYDKSISINPNSAKSFVNRANIYRDRNEFEKAVSDYNRAIELDAGILESYNNRGILFQNRGMNQEALADYSKAISLKPDYVNAFINRGNVYSSLNQVTEAMNDYNKAIAINPKYGLAFYARGLLQQKLADKKKSCEDFQQAVSLGYGAAKNAIKQYCQ